MLLTDFTTYAEVRAVLGVDDHELEDATLELEVYLRGLEVELQNIDIDLPDEFLAVDEKQEDERTALEKRFYGVASVFIPYAVAVQLASSLPLFAPKSTTDGKAAVARDSASPYKATITECKSQFERYRVMLADAYAALEESSAVLTPRPFFSVVAPASDPVTGS